MFGWSHVAPGPGGRTPVQQARSLYYDTLVYDAPTLRHLIDTFGRTQLCIGTDLPFVIQDPEPLRRLDALGVDGELRELLLSGNARRFLDE
jgi:aminocarboxymuconate-semialdehyde decarboxylase